MSEREHELWEAAARCYVQAGEALDACRCLERAGRPSEAAALYEAAGSFREAARCHALAGAHRPAARCYEAAGAWAEAAQSHAQAGDVIDAAWLLAHALGWHGSALQMLAGWSDAAADAAQRAGAGLVRARCDAAAGRLRQAAQALVAVLAGAAAVPEGARVRLRGWAVGVADALARPDLGARAHAALGRGTDEDVRAWEAWALRVLGEVAPYPGAPG
jgi:tetratricopeptide (TPR) repeat protein